MKRLFTLCLALLLLMPAAQAEETEFRYTTSDWAYEDVVKAVDLKLEDRYYWRDLRKPIERREFAETAAALVAVEYGSNLDSYVIIMNYRKEDDNDMISSRALSALDVARNLGIIQGKGDEGEAPSSLITRQEAAVMLARTYHAYHGEAPVVDQPMTYADQDEIAEWALGDVQLVSQLGIMTGVGEDRFDPLGSFTREQCLVSLIRLHESAPYDGSGQENPFVIPAIEGGFAKNYKYSNWRFAFETEEYYVCCWTASGALASTWYFIEIIDQDLNRRTYHTMIVESSNYYRKEGYARPGNAYITEDGKYLVYTAKVDHDVYYTDINGVADPEPVQRKGIYTVTMDLRTGEQTYTRADWDEG